MDALDQIFDLLSEKRRRYALYHLEREDDPVPLDELVEQVAEWETEGATMSIPEEKYQDIAIELHHSELPEAAEAEYVYYDRSKKMVELTSEPPEFDVVLSVAKVIERPDRNP